MKKIFSTFNLADELINLAICIFSLTLSIVCIDILPYNLDYVAIITGILSAYFSFELFKWLMKRELSTVAASNNEMLLIYIIVIVLCIPAFRISTFLGFIFPAVSLILYFYLGLKYGSKTQNHENTTEQGKA